MGSIQDSNAVAAIVAGSLHNHQSGDPTPSRQDISLTRDLVEAARHLKIQVHDYVIIGAEGIGV